jgi:uncharacterized protein (DUF952 family)
MGHIYKIIERTLWEKTSDSTMFYGAAIDLKDGYIHFSNLYQLAKTAEIHFANQDDLILICVEASTLGKALTYEPSRDGDLFPHLYAPLDRKLVVKARPLHRDVNGKIIFDELDT